MTMHRYALAGLLALMLTACSGKHEPAAGTAEDAADADVAATAPAPQAEPPADYAKMAEGVMSLLADAPECQSYRDELQTIVDAPPGTQPARDPALVVAAAHDAGCSKKSRGQ
jgi:hypothetical protein